MKIYIDTNTFPASPALYADAEKTKPLPRIIPLVQGFRGEIEVCFLGELAPKTGDGLTLAMRPYGTGADVVRTETVAVVAGAEAGVAASAKVSLAVNTDALQAAIGTRETLNVLCGVIVTDDAAAFPTRMEWQIVFAVAASALPNGVPAPEISPSAVDVLRDEINAVKTDLAKNYVNRNSSQDVAGVKSFLQGINIGSSANPFGVPEWRIASGGITYFGGGMSMPGNTKILPQGVSSDVVSARAVKGLTSSAGEILIPAKTGTFALVSDVESAVGKALTSAYKYAGQVPTEADLPESAENGDVYDVADTGKNYAYDAKLGRWDALGGTINYATVAEVQALQSAVEAKANDADVVHRSGNETINGEKRFTADIIVDEGYFLKSRLGRLLIGSETSGERFASLDHLSVLPLGTTTALGAPAYGLHVSAIGGLQLFGTHFLNGDIWTDDSVKMVKSNVSLYSTDKASIGFDYANEVVFRTMPNDGTEATYKLEAWKWDDDSHSSKSASAGVRFLKPSQKSALEATSVLNMQEGDARWWRAGSSSIPIKPSGQSSPAAIFLSTYYSGESFELSFAGLEKDGDGYPDVTFKFPFTGGQIALKSDIPNMSFVDGVFVMRDSVSLNNNTDIGNAGILYGFDFTYQYRFPEKTGTVALLDDIVLGSGASGVSPAGATTGSNVAIGPEAKSHGGGTGSETVAIGARSSATGMCSTALGRDTIASNCLAVALGATANATGNQSIAIGCFAMASAYNTIATGENATASEGGAVAIGSNASATNTNSLAIGPNVKCFLAKSFLIGAKNDISLEGNKLCIGAINDDNPGFLFVEQDANATITGVRISKENFMAMLKQFGGEDFTATKPAEEQATE